MCVCHNQSQSRMPPPQQVRRRHGSRPTPGNQAPAARRSPSPDPHRWPSPAFHGAHLSKSQENFAIHVVFLGIVAASALSAYLNPIGDCDEVYNYWEPTHYILYGSGMQTWEYSPAYGLRSYLYVGLHAAIGALVGPICSRASPSRPRVCVFFAIRLVLGLAHSLTMIRLMIAVRRKLGFAVAILTGLAASISPGLFQASTSYLPQSFSMYAVTMAFSHFIEGRSPFGVVFWIGVASLVGWPFVGILAICLAIPLVQRHGLQPCLRATIVTSASCLVPSLAVDYYYYRKWMLAVLNIIKYNVFTAHGADLYGVEPWHYFFRNLLLNFNVVFFAYLLMFPLAASVWVFYRRSNLPPALKSELVKISRSALLSVWPTAVFLAIFCCMAHKEERFLYPIYPLISFGAAVALYLVSFSRILPLSPPIVISVLLPGYLALSCSRTASVIVNYNAPYNVYSAISPGKASICVGKEWYRFPSTFFLPTPDSELLYLKSGFSGLLPRPFARSSDGTRVIPPAMNSLNQEEAERYSEISRCDYVVDLDLPDQKEAHYHWLKEFRTLTTAPFLDASRTPAWCRAFFIPGMSQDCIVAGSYQLLKRIHA